MESVKNNKVMKNEMINGHSMQISLAVNLLVIKEMFHRHRRFVVVLAFKPNNKIKAPSVRDDRKSLDRVKVCRCFTEQKKIFREHQRVRESE